MDCGGLFRFPCTAGATKRKSLPERRGKVRTCAVVGRGLSLSLSLGSKEKGKLSTSVSSF